MMAGKPIVASRVDAIPDIVKDGENGLLVDIDDVEETVQAIMTIYQNPQIRRNIIKGGAQSIKLFDAKRVSLEHQVIFESIE